MRLAPADFDEKVATCKSDIRSVRAARETHRYRSTELSELATGLMPAAERRINPVLIDESTPKATLLAAYQFGGDTLKGLYVTVTYCCGATRSSTITSDRIRLKLAPRHLPFLPSTDPARTAIDS